MKASRGYFLLDVERTLKVSLTILVVIMALLPSSFGRLLAAEYQGRDIDGETFDCTAFSYGTGNYYFGQVEFDGNEAIFYFSSGGHIILTLDDEDIEAPDSVPAFDYKRGVFWELDVNGLD